MRTGKCAAGPSVRRISRGSNERWEKQMRHHDIRMALAAIVAFGPVVFAAAYGVANASRLQAANAPPVASAPVRPVAMPPVQGEERAMVVAPKWEYQITPMAFNALPNRKDTISASLDRARPRH
jgi:hypothetical protein